MINIFNDDIKQLTKAEITKQKIMKSAINEFSSKGFENTTTKDIAKHAGVSEGAIFRYFKSKYELMEKSIMPSVKKFVPAELNYLTKEVLKNNHISFYKFLNSFYDNRFDVFLSNFNELKIYFYRLIFDEKELKTFRQIILKIQKTEFSILIDKFKEKGEIRKDASSLDVVYEISTQFFSAIIRIVFLMKGETNIVKEKSRIISNILTMYGDDTNE